MIVAVIFGVCIVVAALVFAMATAPDLDEAAARGSAAKAVDEAVMSKLVRETIRLEPYTGSSPETVRYALARLEEIRAFASTLPAGLERDAYFRWIDHDENWAAPRALAAWRHRQKVKEVELTPTPQWHN